MRVPWTARRSNQSILKEINPECSLEGLMLKLKLQYFGHLKLLRGIGAVRHAVRVLEDHIAGLQILFEVVILHTRDPGKDETVLGSDIMPPSHFTAFSLMDYL